MKLALSRRIALALVALLALPALSSVLGATGSFDLWVHPRSESYDAARHYKDANGELFYLAENDINSGLGKLRVVSNRRMEIALGDDLFAVLRRSNGALSPVILYDTDGDDAVDSTIFARLEGRNAIFEGEQVQSSDLGNVFWQMGVRYVAGGEGDPVLDGRYLASVAGDKARIEGDLPTPADTAPTPPPVALRPPVDPDRGLVIFKHRQGAEFDLATFVKDPSRYVEDFDRLTRRADDDDWSAEDDGNGGRLHGKLVTHFQDEDMFLVRTEGDLVLDVVWGDIPLEQALRDHLMIEPVAGCYSTLETGLVNPDGSAVTVPHRIVWCPEDSVALFDSPDGYEVGLYARNAEKTFDYTEAGSSIRDNIQLYKSQIWERNASRRATGSVVGNIGAGWRDAGHDMVDAGRRLVPGSYIRNIHTGRIEYVPSPITAIPRALYQLATLHPHKAIWELGDGIESAVDAPAYVVSAAHNTALNTVIQGTVGTALSPGAADSTSDWVGAVTQTVVKNVPFSKRTIDAYSLSVARRHDASWAPRSYTRTDTQLNIDRIVSLLDAALVRAIDNHNDDGGGPGPECDPKHNLKKQKGGRPNDRHDPLPSVPDPVSCIVDSLL